MQIGMKKLCFCSQRMANLCQQSGSCLPLLLGNDYTGEGGEMIK